MKLPSEFDPNVYPPFPNALPVSSLATISLAKLINSDIIEQGNLFEACSTQGFFYLDLVDTRSGFSLSEDSVKIARLAEKVFGLAQAEKDSYASDFNKTIFGYKKNGVTLVDKKGTRDTAEFYNISKDLLYSSSPLTDWPTPILGNQALLQGFIETAHDTGLMILSKLAVSLSLPSSAFDSLHRIHAKSGDHIRLTRGPPLSNPASIDAEIQTPAHTDFGSITILMNWLGGLQVLTPSDEWAYIKPKANHAIINLGDAMVKFTNGVLKSGKHRVVPAPGDQGKFPRYSIVYFVRPEDDIVLEALHSASIPEETGEVAREELTAKEWILRRAQSLQRGE